MTRLVTVSASYTRPADTTAYTAGDVVANSTSAATVLTFSGAVKHASHGGFIRSASIVDSVAAATKPQLDLFLFNKAPVMQNDNAAFAATDAEMLNCVGVITFDGPNKFVVGGANGLIPASFLGTQNQQGFKCAPGDTNLYGVLVARNAYTPTASEAFQVSLDIERE